MIRFPRNSMKLSELIEVLTALKAQHGDVDVYSHNDMIADEPSPSFVQGGSYMAEGVYLN